MLLAGHQVRVKGGLGIDLLPEVFVAEKFVDMLEKVVVDGPGLFGVLNDAVSCDATPLNSAGSVCDVLPGVEVEENWFLHTDQSRHILRGSWGISSISWLCFSAVVVSPGFRKLLEMILAIDHRTVTITFLGKVLPLESILQHERGPTAEPNDVDCRDRSISYFTAQSDQEASYCYCLGATQKEPETRDFLNFAQFVRD